MGCFNSKADLYLVQTFDRDDNLASSGSSTYSPAGTHPRRNSDAITPTNLYPTTRHALLDVDGSGRSRSSSVGDASMLSGVTARPETPYNGIDTLSVEEALKPDPGTENDFKVDGINPFGFTPGQLNKFLNPKSLAAYKAVGGVRGLEKGLRTDLEAGLSIDEGLLDGAVSFDEAIRHKKNNSLPNVEQGQGSEEAADGAVVTRSTTAGSANFVDRKRIFKDNVLPLKHAKTIWMLMWEQYQDKILLLLSAAAIISLALGLYETFGVDHPPGSPPSVDWIEGVAIVVAIIIVVLVGSLNDWQKERQFVKLNAKVRFHP